MYIYTYKKQKGVLCEINKMPITILPVINNEFVGFYKIEDIKDIDNTLLCYDDLMGGGYCGGEIVLCKIEDLENEGNIINEFVSSEFMLKNNTY